MKFFRGKSGITLIALIITIIVLIILAGITLSMLTGNSPIINTTGAAKNAAEIANEKEIIEISATQAMRKSETGNIEQENLDKCVNSRIKANVTQNGNNVFIVEIEASKRKYLVSDESEVREVTWWKEKKKMEI